MKEVLENLELQVRRHEGAIELTPTTYSGFTQEEHDAYHEEMAENYKKAIKILTGSYVVRDWMVGEVSVFTNYDDAKADYNQRVKDSLVGNGDCDVQLFVVTDEFNNVD